ncbi:hypothetical protein CSUI_002786 [Cystoisospora suis]|uniref:Uncharacterized protein n=1 Tax=Cystoisospora suis TaxID=483139 RepID=A0A2C6L7Q1_9APIC|nr:hypothetical protein CSUI_002786 [Cystoisospora suis]
MGAFPSCSFNTRVSLSYPLLGSVFSFLVFFFLPPADACFDCRSRAF